MKSQNITQISEIKVLSKIERIKEINELKVTNKLMIKLSTRLGFYDYYFQMCKLSETNEISFNKVNNVYFNLFGEYRYKDFNSFHISVNFYSKSKLKN